MSFFILDVYGGEYEESWSCTRIFTNEETARNAIKEFDSDWYLIELYKGNEQNGEIIRFEDAIERLHQ